jgi:site-specific recombinase XerD
MSNEFPYDSTRQPPTLVPRRFDPRIAAPFVEKSVSEATRRAYRRITQEFFAFVGNIHPSLVTPEHVLRWRELMRLRKKKPNTIALKLSVVRSLFEYLKAGGYVTLNPAATRLVPPPEVPEGLSGRALTPKEVKYLLSGPDRQKPVGARDYAMLIVMLKLGVRVSEACSLRASSMMWSHGRWIIKFKVKGGRERTLPLPSEVKKAIDDYVLLDRKRREQLHSDGADAFLFQPHLNYRTLEFNKGLSTRMAWNIVRKWAEFTGLNKLSPHDLRRTAITKALDQGLSYRQVQMMSGHKDPKTVMRYDHGRENLDMNAVNFLNYDEPEG